MSAHLSWFSLLPHHVSDTCSRNVGPALMCPSIRYDILALSQARNVNTGYFSPINFLDNKPLCNNGLRQGKKLSKTVKLPNDHVNSTELRLLSTAPSIAFTEQRRSERRKAMELTYQAPCQAQGRQINPRHLHPDAISEHLA